jgi:hypothetical protein
MESATEKIPPNGLLTADPILVRVKRCGKSAPRCWQQQRQGKPRPEQGQIGIHDTAARSLDSGRLLEVGGDVYPRVMTVPDRTRLIG